MDTATFQRTVGRKRKLLSLALVQDMRVVKIHIGGDQKSMGNARTSRNNLHAHVAVLCICLQYVDTPPNPLLPPSLPTVHASAVKVGFDGGSAAGAARPPAAGFCWLKDEGGFVVQVTFVYVLSASFALESSSEMFWRGSVFLEAPSSSYSVQL